MSILQLLSLKPARSALFHFFPTPSFSPLASALFPAQLAPQVISFAVLFSRGQRHSTLSVNCNYPERFEKIAMPGPHPQRYHLIGVEWTPGPDGCKRSPEMLTCSGVWRSCLRVSFQSKDDRCRCSPGVGQPADSAHRSCHTLTRA